MGAPGPYGFTITEHFRRPRNYGALPGAAASAEGANPLCGDRVRLAVTVDGAGNIADARFVANACAICIASASLLTERLQGLSLGAAAAVSEDDALASLDADIPAARRRCATLPLEALRRLLAELQHANLGAPPLVDAILLAAGSAERFGGPHKLLAPVATPEGEQPLARAAAIELRAPGVRELVVVLGREADLVRESLAGVAARFVCNGDYLEGLSSSLRSGVHAVLATGRDLAGVLVALADQPLEGGVVEAVVSSFASIEASERPRVIVAARYAGTIGHPVVFGRDVLPELLALTGDQGARGVIARDAQRVRHVDFALPLPIDVDTPADLRRLAEHRSRIQAH